MRARELLKDGERAVAIFTRGEHFSVDANGGGESGSWVIDPRRQVDKVIIYYRRGSSGANDIYIANHAGSIPSPMRGRYIIRLTSAHLVGSTSVN